MNVTLTESEVRLAAFAGVERNISSRVFADKFPEADDLASPHNGWQIDIVGTLGEFAWAKANGLFWDGASGYVPGGRDVARFEVRSTTYVDGHLIVRKKDPIDAAYILVCGRPPRFTIPGWISGREAKQEKYWRTDRGLPAYFVPQSAFHPLDELLGDIG